MVSNQIKFVKNEINLNQIKEKRNTLELWGVSIRGHSTLTPRTFLPTQLRAFDCARKKYIHFRHFWVNKRGGGGFSAGTTVTRADAGGNVITPVDSCTYFLLCCSAGKIGTSVHWDIGTVILSTEI